MKYKSISIFAMNGIREKNSDKRIVTCICLWYDLLGYGAPFIKSNWNLENENCLCNIERMDNLGNYFQGLWSSRFAKKLHLNDGIITNIDIEIQTSDFIEKLLYFLEGAVVDFFSANNVDKRNGFYGMRGVITIGQRFDYLYADEQFNLTRNEVTVYHPREFQMNTAFSKAYIMEESGSRMGLCGDHLYIDKAVFNFLEEHLSKIENSGIYIYEKNKKIEIKFIYKGLEFLILGANNNVVHYNNKGINTDLFQIINYHSYIDDYAKDEALQRASRIAAYEMETLDEE